MCVLNSVGNQNGPSNRFDGIQIAHRRVLAHRLGKLSCISDVSERCGVRTDRIGKSISVFGSKYQVCDQTRTSAQVRRIRIARVQIEQIKGKF